MSGDLEPVLLAATRDDPADDTPWLVLADWLEERGQLERAELIRLHRSLRARQPAKLRRMRERRVCSLLAGGKKPCVWEVVNSVNMRLALIPSGEFRQGVAPGDPHPNEDEQPRRRVTISKPYFMGVFQVTQGEYAAVTDRTPSHFQAEADWDSREGAYGARLPVEMVSWAEAADYCRSLSSLPAERIARRAYRLPTEAEWEYACRGGASSLLPFHVGKGLSAHQANFDGNFPCAGTTGVYRERTTPVGTFPPNAFGLYDMHGNVWEWCQDWYAFDAYAQGAATDPQGPERGDTRVQRGGSWYSYGWACRSAQRSRSDPGDRNSRSGFRVVMVQG